MSDQPGPLVFDACSLIDIVDANMSVLGLVVQHVGPILIPTPVLAEVDSLDEAQCRALGIEVIEPTLEELDAAAEPDGALSFPDRICLVTARSRRAICVTGDEALGTRCVEEELETWRGLRPLLALVEVGALALETSIAIVDVIAGHNGYITPAVVAEFRRRATELDERRQPEPGSRRESRT